MTSLIEDVTVDFKEFWDLPILRGKTTYAKTSYDSTNALLLLDRLSEYGENDDLVIVNPEDPSSTLLLVIESLLSLLKFDSLESSSKILSTIKPGDTVGLVHGRSVIPGTYIGREERDGQLYYCVKTADGGTTKMPPELSKTKIQPYMGGSATDKKRRKALVYGKQLESLMNLPAGGLMAFQHSKALLVTPEKGKIIEALRGVTLGGDSIETIFPMASYSSLSDCRHIGANALAREPILGIVSNTDLAVDIARKDPDIRLIIIDGAAKIRPHYPSIELLNSGDVPRKIVCLLKSSDEDEIKALQNMGIDIWTWKRQDFKDTSRGTADIRNLSDPFKLHDEIVTNLAGSEPRIIDITTTTSFDATINGILSSIRKISRQAGDDQEIGYVLRWSVSILQRMLQLPVSVSGYHLALNASGLDSGQLKIDSALKAFETKLRTSYGSKIASSLKESFEELIKQLQRIFTEISNFNPKANALQTLITEYGREPVTIISCRPEHIAALKSIYKHRGNVSVIGIKEVGKVPAKNVIVCGWLNRKTSAKFFLAPYQNISFLFYGNEARSYKALLHNHPASPDSTIDSKLRSLFNKTAAESVDENPAQEENISDIDKLLTALNVQFGSPAYSEHLHHYENGETIAARRVIFEEESFTYVTEKTRLNKLDTASQTPVTARLESIAVGDELVFAGSEKNLFDELLDIVKQSEKYKSVVETAELWHIALQNYMTDTGTTEQQLSEQLALLGCKPGRGTLRSWIAGKVISPSSGNLRAIVKVIDNQQLSDKYADIVNACSALHSLHIQTGRLLVRKIIDAAAHSDESLDDDTTKKIEAYAQGAKIVVVEQISESMLEVPVKAIGILFEP